MSMNETEKEPAIEIGPATVEDVPGLQAVWHKTWLATYPNEKAGITVEDIEDRYKDAYSEERMEKRREQIRNPEPGSTFLAAREGERIIGLCRVLASPDRNKLGAIYVLPGYQGKGIGRKLWKEAEKFLDLSKDTFVEVVEYNENAIGFYKKLGFVDSGRIFHDEKFVMKSGAVLPEMEMILKAKQ